MCGKQRPRECAIASCTRSRRKPSPEPSVNLAAPIRRVDSPPGRGRCPDRLTHESTGYRPDAKFTLADFAKIARQLAHRTNTRVQTWERCSHLLFMSDGSDEFVWAVYVSAAVRLFARLLSDCIVRRRLAARVSPLSYRAIRRAESRLERLRAMQQKRALLCSGSSPRG